MLFNSGTVAEWVRASVLSQSEWIVPSLNPGKGRNYFYPGFGDGGLRITRIDGYVIAIKFVTCIYI